LSIIITILLTCFYGIPIDPNTNRILADGTFQTAFRTSGYTLNIPYAYAQNTSDPEGGGKTLTAITQQNDMGVEYRMALSTRWSHFQEWEFALPMRDFIFFLGVLHILLTMLKCTSYLVLDFPLTLFDKLDELEHENEISNKSSGGSDASSKQGAEYLRDMPDYPMSQEGRLDARSVLKMSQVLLDPFRYGLFLCMSILGLTNSPFFYAFCLLEYFTMRGGRDVLRALYFGGPQLMKSFMLGLIVLVVFGFMSYAFFSTAAIETDESCHTLYQCVAKHVADALRGDITTVLGNFANFTHPALVFWADVWEAWKTLYIVVFLVWWWFLLQPIIQGQIITAFSQLLERQRSARTDMNTRCFISGISRFDFNNYPGEWECRASGKYAWNFFLYMRHLKTVDVEDVNGMEASVLDAYESGSGAFLPVGVFAAKQWETVTDPAADWRRSMTSMFQKLQLDFKNLDKRIAEMSDNHNAKVSETGSVPGSQVSRQAMSPSSALRSGDVASPLGARPGSDFFERS